MPRSPRSALSPAPLVLVALSLSFSGCCGCGDALVEILISSNGSPASSSSAEAQGREPPKVGWGKTTDDDQVDPPDDTAPDRAPDRVTGTPEALTAPRGVAITTDVDRYDVRGETADAIRSDMNFKRPTSNDGSYDAHTDWNVSWTFQRVPRAGACVIEDVNVKLSVRYQLPQWEPPPGAPSSLVKRWNRYLTALNGHERNHAIHGLSAAEEVQRKLASLAPATTCDEAEASANREGTAIVEAHARRDPEYDLSTTHGKTEGAVFP